MPMWRACASCWQLFPDADPARPFAAAGCIRVTLRGGRHPIEIPREAPRAISVSAEHLFGDC